MRVTERRARSSASPPAERAGLARAGREHDGLQSRMAERRGRFAASLNGDSGDPGGETLASAPVQLCKDPATIGKGKEARQRLEGLKAYAETMYNKAMERGNGVLEANEALAELWWGLADQFQKVSNDLTKYAQRPDQEIPFIVEAGEGELAEQNLAYAELKSQEIGESSQSHGSSKSSKKEVKRGSNNNNDSDEEEPAPKSFASELGFPSRLELSKNGVKGKGSLSSKARTKIIGICKEMAGLKQVMVSAREDDLSSHVHWVELFHSLVDFIRFLAANEPEQYLALINNGMIGEIEEMKTLIDNGVMCNEELPNNIIRRL